MGAGRVTIAHGGDAPLADMMILLIGLPLAAAVGGWLLAGHEPEAIGRQPLD